MSEERDAADAGTAGAEPKTIVHLVRHGEVANPDGILYGRIPGYHLSEDGRMMAKAAAGFLAEGPPGLPCFPFTAGCACPHGLSEPSLR